MMVLEKTFQCENRLRGFFKWRHHLWGRSRGRGRGGRREGEEELEGRSVDEEGLDKKAVGEMARWRNDEMARWRGRGSICQEDGAEEARGGGTGKKNGMRSTQIFQFGTFVTKHGRG